LAHTAAADDDDGVGSGLAAAAAAEGAAVGTAWACSIRLAKSALPEACSRHFGSLVDEPADEQAHPAFPR